ncbi:MAG: RNA pseudouridine synthase [Thalassobaculales bacterium]
MSWSAETIAARLLHRDGLVLVIDKPAGLPVHAGPGGGEHLEMYLEGLRFGLPQLPQLAHRLDRDTSGCLVLGRHRKALRKLGRLFSEGLAEKTYWAVVSGSPGEPEGRIEAPLKKLTTKAGWKMVTAADGQPAATGWRVLGSGYGLSFVAFQPFTGRTHQIRVHAAALGCPVLGDAAYGPKGQGKPLHLHARRIVLPLKAGQPPLVVEAPVPAHMQSALSLCGWRP